MTQPGAELAEPAKPPRLLKLVASAGRYAVTPGDTAASCAAHVGTSATTPAAPVVKNDWSAPSPAVADAVSASVVAITVTSGHRRGRGAGVIFDSAGHILTRYRVVAATGPGCTIVVTLKDKRTFEAKVVATDPSTDLAFIELTNAPEDLKAIALDDARAFTVGDPEAS